MKKTLLPITGLTIAATAGASVVSCISAAYNPGLEGERIALITDAGVVTDKSFNESMYHAINDYSNRAPKEGVGGGFNFTERHLSAAKNYVQPLKTDYSELVAAYKVAYLKGTDILVLSGFQHASAVPAASEMMGPDKTVVFADSNVNNKPNVINLVYNSQLAGFAAGYNAAVWASKVIKDSNGWHYQGAAPNTKTDAHTLSLGLFGGISNKNSVDNYLWGMLVAVDYFNKRATLDDAEKNPDGQAKHIYLANNKAKGEVGDITNISNTDVNFFTGSFDLGGAIRTGMVDNLAENGANIIFPVAGPQTLDVLTNTSANIIGVDTNQGLQFPDFTNRFITSAQKDISISLKDAFDHAKANRLNHNEDGSLKEQPVYTKPEDKPGTIYAGYWDGKIITGKPAWSTAVDGDGSKIPAGGSLVPWTLSDDDIQGMAKVLIDDYNATGSSTTDYLKGSVIQEVSDKLLKNYKLLDLVFSSKL